MAPQDSRSRMHHRPQSLGGAIRAPFLNEGQRDTQHHHHEDDDRRLDIAGDQRDRGQHQQQDVEWIGYPLQELSRDALHGLTCYRVESKLLEAFLSGALDEALQRTLESLEHLISAQRRELRRIALGGGVGFAGVLGTPSWGRRTDSQIP